MTRSDYEEMYGEGRADFTPDPVDPPTRPCTRCGAAVPAEWDEAPQAGPGKHWVWYPPVHCEDCEAAEHRKVAAAERAAGFPSLAAAHEAQAQEIEEHGA